MRQIQTSKGQEIQSNPQKIKGLHSINSDFVLEKGIFNNIFEKDIRRVFIYKKAERLAKVLHLITPAFSKSITLGNRVDAIAISLLDSASLPPTLSRTTLSRELLSLSSLLSIAHSSKLLSDMNIEIITREAHILLQEISDYEDPQLSLEEVPTLSSIAKSASRQSNTQQFTTHKNINTKNQTQNAQLKRVQTIRTSKGQVKDKPKGQPIQIKDRQSAVLSVIRSKGNVRIKDISTLVRGVSEKTIQRELIILIKSGLVIKRGERRWSTYSLS